MRKKIIRGGNKIIALLMAILGFASSCKDDPWFGMVAAYGTPSAFYIIKGTVTSAKDNSPVKGIRVVAKTADLSMKVDTVKTDASGNYSAIISALETKQQVNLSYSDIDGLDNGAFQPLDSLVSFTNAKFTGGDGKWNQGTAEATVNIKMKPKL